MGSFNIVLLYLEQGIASGVVSGSIYALLALALVMIFKTTDVPNFAEGDIFMVAGYSILYLTVVQTLPVWTAALLTVAITGALMAGFQRVILDAIRRRGGNQVSLVIGTLGLSYILKALVNASSLSGTPQTFSAPVPNGGVQLGFAHLTWLDIFIISTTLVVLAVTFAFFRFTKAGRAARAVGMNPKAAALVGVDIKTVRASIWAASGVLAAVAMLLMGPKLLLTPSMGAMTTVGFAAAIIGGLESLGGAVLGGFILGICQNLIGLFVSSSLVALVPFLAIIVVLAVRPQGLFGGSYLPRKV